jgi:tRNA dimethylallyltransferase
MTARLVAVVGPTASGKSAVGMTLAERVGAHVVSADARQVYRGLDIGTAKPTTADRRRVVHHCLDLVEPSETFDVARWVAAADAGITAATRAGRPVVVVGGTGLYVRALLGGLCAAAPRRPDLRAALSTLAARTGERELYRWLARLDPAAAERIHPNDRVRIERALEVVLSTGVPLSRLQGAHGFATRRYEARVLVLAYDGAALDARIEARTDALIGAGWIDEVATLAARLPDDAPGWRTLGYRELRDHVRGAVALAVARAAVVQATRRFAKRQRTWWRREARATPLTWVDPARGTERALEDAAAFVAKRTLDR